MNCEQPEHRHPRALQALSEASWAEFSSPSRPRGWRSWRCSFSRDPCSSREIPAQHGPAFRLLGRRQLRKTSYHLRREHASDREQWRMEKPIRTSGSTAADMRTSGTWAGTCTMQVADEVPESSPALQNDGRHVRPTSRGGGGARPPTVPAIDGVRQITASGRPITVAP